MHTLRYSRTFRTDRPFPIPFRSIMTRWMLASATNDGRSATLSTCIIADRKCKKWRRFQNVLKSCLVIARCPPWKPGMLTMPILWTLCPMLNCAKQVYSVGRRPWTSIGRSVSWSSEKPLKLDFGS